VSTLVVCLDRSGDVVRAAGVSPPVVGWEAVRSLVLDVGLADPEDSSVNCLLEALRVTRELRDGDEEATVAVLAGDGDAVGAGRAIAAQIEAIRADGVADTAIIVLDSSEDERLVPVIESRLPVDSVDRVVVRQARDIESTYYLLKQFLADEELRQTTLVPVGLALLVFPVLVTYMSPVVAVASITAVFGLFLLYKGLAIDRYVATVPAGVRDALYSGQVSVVTYVVAAGLALIGVFAGLLGVSNLPNHEGVLVPAMQFAFDSVPWLAMAALAASTGRLLDEAIRDEPVPGSYLNLPFGVIALGVVVRGFSAYFLQRSDVIAPTRIPPLDVGVLSVEGFALSPIQRLAVFVVVGVVVSLVGVRTASYLGGPTPSEPEATD
jgi:putative membrane protein